MADRCDRIGVVRLIYKVKNFRHDARREGRIDGTLSSCEARSRNDDAGEAAEVGVAGHELRVADARGGIDDGVHSREAVVEAGGGGGQGDRLVEWNDFLMHGLRDEAVGHGLTSKLGELFVDLVEHDRGNEHGRFRFDVVPEGGGLRILGEVFEPAGRVHDEEIRSAA